MPITKINIKCDYCGWKEEADMLNVPNWHNVSCPKCHQGEIVSDKDLKDFKQIQTLMKWNDRIVWLMQLIGLKPKLKNVKFDSAVDDISDLPAKFKNNS